MCSVLHNGDICLVEIQVTRPCREKRIGTHFKVLHTSYHHTTWPVEPSAKGKQFTSSLFLRLEQGGEELLVLVNAESNQPEVFLPSGPFSVNEDEEVSISGARVADRDMEVSANYELAVRLSVEQGVLSLNSTDGLGFSVGDGVEDEFVFFHGSATSVGDALASITYRGHFNWWVFWYFSRVCKTKAQSTATLGYILG